jgi:hypothetical protein
MIHRTKHDLIIKIKPFRPVLGSITDRDNHGEVAVPYDSTLLMQGKEHSLWQHVTDALSKEQSLWQHVTDALSIPYDSTLLMQDTQYPTSRLNLVMQCSLSDDRQALNAQHHVCSHSTEGDYSHICSSWESCQARLWDGERWHSEGEDTDGGDLHVAQVWVEKSVPNINSIRKTDRYWSLSILLGKHML